MASYIYLLKEREFIKTNEDIYKIGKTRQNNVERFKQYPKGSILLLQKICDDCDKMEKILLKKFKGQFKQRKDIGAEYFEGNCNEMCKEIEDTINDANDNYNDDESSGSSSSEEEENFIIDTYEKLIKFTCIQRIVITHKKKLNGFLKSVNWREIKDINETDFNKENDESLDGWIENNMESLVIDKTTKEIIRMTEQIKEIHFTKSNEFNKKYKWIGATCDLEKIKKDVSKKCYDKNAKPYELKYHEYVISKSHPASSTVREVIFDLLSFEVTDICHERIVLKRKGYRNISYLNADKNIDIKIIFEILMKLTDNNIKKINEFRSLCYNTFVKPSLNIIFYDNNHAVSFTSLLISTSITLGIYDDSICYINENNYKELMKNKKRVFILLPIKSLKERDNIIRYAQENGVLNLIIIEHLKYVNYNLKAIDEYFDINKEKIKKIMLENNAVELSNQLPETIIERYLFCNILKWFAT